MSIYVYPGFLLSILVFYCVNIKYFPIIDNEKILYPFCKLLIVFACIDQVMLTVCCAICTFTKSCDKNYSKHGQRTAMMGASMPSVSLHWNRPTGLAVEVTG
jgi:hypothetical protein